MVVATAYATEGLHVLHMSDPDCECGELDFGYLSTIINGQVKITFLSHLFGLHTIWEIFQELSGNLRWGKIDVLRRF